MICGKNYNIGSEKKISIPGLGPVIFGGNDSNIAYLKDKKYLKSLITRN